MKLKSHQGRDQQACEGKLSIRRAVRTALANHPILKMTRAAIASGSLVLAGIGVSALAPNYAVAAAYTTVDVAGHVVNEKGQPIPSAKVELVSDQGTVRSVTADNSGAFRLSAIPGGTYKATVQAPGFASLESRVITVAPGASTFAFTLGKEGEKLDEVTVSAVRSIKDFGRTDSGISLDVQDIADRTPLARSINATVMLAPTVSLADPSIVANGVRRNQNAVTVAGTSAAESAYYVNGLNVTDQRTFLGYADLPFEMIKTIEVKTGGYQAEFGRGTGGIINIVTRSGSNDFHWGVSAYWSPDSLRASRPTTYRPGGNNSVGIIDIQGKVKQDFSEQTVWASGAIWKDKIFFMGLVNPRQTDNWLAVAYTNPTTNNGTYTNTQYNDPRYAAKLDFVFTDNHRVEATYFSDTETSEYQPWNYGKAENAILPVAGLTNEDGSLLKYSQKSGGSNAILQYTGVFSPNLTLSALAGRTKSHYGDFGPYIEQPGILDFGTTGGSVTLGRQAGPFNLVGVDTRDTYRLDADVYFNGAGEHHVRVGYDYEDLLSTAVSAYSGGALYYGYVQGDCPAGAGVNGCVEKLTFANIGDFKAIQSAWYVQDSWSITPSLTLQFGLRGDVYDYKNVQGQSYVKISDQIAPRIGFSWNMDESGRNRMFASMGDYYLPIATNTSIRASSGEVYTDQYFQTTRDGAGNLVIDASGFPTVGAQIGPTDYFSPPSAPDPRSVIAADLKPMFEREFSIGFEHRFDGGWFDGWSAGLRYTKRELESTIEDTAIGDAINRYCIRNGLPCEDVDPSIYPFVLVNPGDPARVFLDINGEGRADAAGNPNPAYDPQWIDLTKGDMNLPSAVRKYDGIELTFNRPFDDVWSLQGSYLWSKSRGNYEGAVKSDVGQTDTSITQDFDHAANMIGAFGALPNDRRHSFKLSGSYSMWEKFTAGANLIVQSGRPYGCIGYVPPAVDPLAPNSGTPSSWFCPRGAQLANVTGALATQLAALGVAPSRFADEPTTRGSQGRTDWVTNLDLSFAYRLFEGAKGSSVMRLDVYNVLNADSVSRVVEQGEVRTAATGAKNVPAPFYGQPRTYQAPRSVRVGFSYEF